MDREIFVETYGFPVDVLDELLESKNYRQLRERINELNEADIAEYLEELPDEKRLLVFRMLQKDLASEVFAFFEVETQEFIINAITDAELGRIIEDLFVDDAVDMLEELPATVVRRVLKNAKPATRNLINQFLNYPENSAGSIMTAEYLSVKKEWEVHDAFDYIRANGQDSETIYVLYVTDARRRLEGVVTIKDLLMNSYESKIGDIMEENVIRCVTTDDQEDVAELFTHYDLLSLPVVDQENRLVGIVSVDDAVDVMEEEATEDIELMAGIVPTDDTYLRTGVLETFKSRIPWLVVLMLGSTFTGIIITTFENALATCVALTGFIPMLMGTAGNSGSQASVSIIRAMSLGDVEFSDIIKVIWKEVRVAVVCGLSLAIVCFGKIWLIDNLLLGHDINLMVDLVVSLSAAFVVVIAKLVGAVLPMLVEKIGLDPAVMASPLITTIMDTVSLLIYFVFAQQLLGIVI